MTIKEAAARKSNYTVMALSFGVKNIKQTSPNKSIGAFAIGEQQCLREKKR